MSTTSRFIERFSRGVLVVSVTEAADAVHIAITAPPIRETDADYPKLARLLQSIIVPFGEDPRPMRISGNRADWSCEIRGTDSAGAFAIVTPAAARGAVQ